MHPKQKLNNLDFVRQKLNKGFNDEQREKLESQTGHHQLTQDRIKVLNTGLQQKQRNITSTQHHLKVDNILKTSKWDSSPYKPRPAHSHLQLPAYPSSHSRNSILPHNLTQSPPRHHDYYRSKEHLPLNQSPYIPKITPLNQTHEALPEIRNQSQSSLDHNTIDLQSEDYKRVKELNKLENSPDDYKYRLENFLKNPKKVEKISLELKKFDKINRDYYKEKYEKEKSRMKNKWLDKIKMDSLKAKFQYQYSYPPQPFPMVYPPYLMDPRGYAHQYSKEAKYQKRQKYSDYDYSSSFTGNISENPGSFYQSYSNETWTDGRHRGDYSEHPGRKSRQNKGYNNKKSVEGIMLYLHYFKNFPMNIAKHVYIRSRLQLGADPIRDDKDREMSWNTSLINMADFIPQNERGHQMLREMKADQEINQPFTILPIMESTNWMKDFYTMVWDNGNRDKVYIMFEVCEKSSPWPLFYAKLQLTRHDGTIRFGRDELPLYKYTKHRGKERKDKIHSYLVLIIHFSEKENSIDEQIDNVTADDQQSAYDKRDTADLSEKSKPLQKSPRDSVDYQSQNYEEEKGDIKKDDHIPENNEPREISEKPFIENSKRDIPMKDFEPNSMIVFYIDSARFLHENATLTKVIFRAIDESGNTILKPQGTICDLSDSTCQHPFFDYRTEIYRGVGNLP
ncbi:unnamed protein product [Moneuplotes crassus]|uniref:Uncharacterized protein n=1 Tax=Euplotes crassus TaxID=5936 RepID=A0AAD2DCH9_EUPCR|nr:unnamed protein product [Moneuplotes crassus]